MSAKGSGKYARGHKAVAICERCSKKRLRRHLVYDGQYPDLLVCPECWDPKHPQEYLPPVTDPVTIYDPTGDPDRLAANVTVVPLFGGSGGLGGAGGGAVDVVRPLFPMSLRVVVNATKFNLLAGDSLGEPQGWPELNTFVQQDTAEWVRAESSNVRFIDDGTRIYRGCFNNGVSGGLYYGVDYATGYLPTDSNSPVQILTTNEEVNDCAFNGDGTKVFITLDDGTGTVQERTNIGTPFKPEAGDIDTVAYTYNSTNLIGIIQSIEFNTDGTVVYLTGRSAVVGCVQAVLSTPWDLSTAGTETTIDFTDMGANASQCLRIAPDGIKFYVASNNTAYEYECTVPFDVTGSAVYQSRTLDIRTPLLGTQVMGFDVSPDGTTLVSGGRWDNNAANNDTNRFTS